ncbi:MAG: hypothetical protein O7H39_03980 [Gammaproteobacteria bacterium]|nr:hypothetical protein [Gammaproteobacteria bacterium]
MIAFVMALVATVAMPTGTSTGAGTKVDAAAADVAAAVRFARDESSRTGNSFGVRQQQSRVRVFRLDGVTLVYDVYHPIAKQEWDIQLAKDLPYRGVQSARSVAWRGVCNADRNIAFRDGGTPVCTSPTTTLLDQGVLTLTLDGASRNVVIDGFTGRVSIQ